MSRRETQAEYISRLCVETEGLIRSGELKQARRLLSALKVKTVPREFASALANRARRSGDPQKSLEILWPILRSEGTRSFSPSPEEGAEYAVALLRVGAVEEAIRTLESAGAENSKVILYLGFAHMVRWSYGKAIPCFENYLSRGGISEYEREVARINLAACFVGVGDRASAKPLLEEALTTTASREWELLRKNALELRAQLAGQESDWEGALALLSLTGDVSDINKNDLWVWKWRAIATLFLQGPSPATYDAMEKVIRRATEAGSWETVRECDSYKALVSKDPALLTKVYFGTPFVSYRDEMMKRSVDWFDPPNEYLWQLGESDSDRIFDLKEAEETGGRVRLKPGSVLHRALQVLTSDFYRPFLLGTLYSRIFPEDYFNPQSGALRLHRVLSRLRSWFEENRIPIGIGASAAGFRLVAHGPYAFLLRKAGRDDLASGSEASHRVLVDRLRERWPRSQFSSGEAARFLRISERLVRDIFRWAVTNEMIVKHGAGPATRYEFPALGSEET